MNEHKVIPGALIGTTAMTAFSYIASAIEHSNFKEPELLGLLAHRLSPNKTVMKLAGWPIHYAIGLAFVKTYAWLWQHSKMKPTPGFGLLLGGISGIIGILVWKWTFRLHPDPPQIKFSKYYRQLLAAHIIFGLFSVIGYNTRFPRNATSQEALALE